MKKKILSITIIIILALLAVLAAWYFLARNDDQSLGDFIAGNLPFGSWEDIGPPVLPPTDIGGLPTDVGPFPFDELGVPTVSLFRISSTPVAGFVTFMRQGETIVRYADRATGHINDAILPRGTTTATSLDKIRVTNVTLPKIYEAYFRNDGNAVLYRYLRNDSDVVENVSLTLIPRATSTATSSSDTESFQEVSSVSLRGDISSVAVGEGNNLFYSLRDANAISASTFNGSDLRTIFSSPFTDWRLVSAGNTLLAHTKASAFAPGYAYILNTSSGALTRVAGPINGLAAIPNAAGNRVIYSYSNGSATRTFAKNPAGNDTYEIIPSTLAEKCVWSTLSTDIFLCAAPMNSISGGEPDGWYRGATSFSDRIWKFDYSSEMSELVSEPIQAAGINVDAINLDLSPEEDYLIFINKTDLSLWALRLGTL